MRVSATIALCASLLALNTEAQAQDLIGFDRSSYGRVVLNRTESAAGGFEDSDLELSIGSYNNEAITKYSEDSIFAQIGLSVGRLDILTDSGIFPCTAFIVDSKHVLTNYHCVPGILENERARATSIQGVQFVAGYRQTGVQDGTETYLVNPVPVEAHKDLDYALLEVFNDPSAKYGTLQLTDRTPRDGDPYWVIGHPMGEGQRISREQCRANAPALSGGRLLHTCDTLPGNSGSPVIDASLQMVVALHHAGSKKDSVNFAIPMREILERSDILKAALRDPRPGPVDDTPKEKPEDTVVIAPAPETNMCNLMYEEAKAFDRCFAYEAYLAQCTDHAFAGIGRFYVENNCQAADSGGVTPVPPQDNPPPVADTAPLRPWCGNGGLNATERAICGSAYLAGLDEELGRAYASQSGRASAAQQSAWRTGTRDRCGSNESCIGQTMIERITYLSQPAPPPPVDTGPSVIAGNYELSGNRCYIVTASRSTISEAQSFARDRFSRYANVRVFRSTNGFWAITVATVSRGDADTWLNRLKARNLVPGDSYCSTGSRFNGELSWNTGGGSNILDAAGSGGGGGGGTTGKTMWVNSSDGELNVRSGAGTNNSILTVIRTGSTVSVIGSSGNWSRVRVPNGTVGWVYTPLLSTSKPAPQTTCWARVVNLDPRSRGGNNSFLSIRTGPGTRNSKVSETYLGDRLKVLSRSNGWAQVQCVSGGCQNPNSGRGGATGWSSQKYLSISCN